MNYAGCPPASEVYQHGGAWLECHGVLVSIAIVGWRASKLLLSILLSLLSKPRPKLPECAVSATHAVHLYEASTCFSWGKIACCQPDCHCRRPRGRTGGSTLYRQRLAVTEYIAARGQLPGDLHLYRKNGSIEEIQMQPVVCSPSCPCFHDFELHTLEQPRRNSGRIYASSVLNQIICSLTSCRHIDIHAQQRSALLCGLSIQIPRNQRHLHASS